MQTREDFFNGFWGLLKKRGWKSLVLHSWKELPSRIDSDVDYAVAGCRPNELISALDEYSRERGWLLVQVIEHEPSAFFCVCVQDGGEFQRLALDVTWDYRRLGHRLMDSDSLMKGRRTVSGKAFMVPSVGVEASYVLAKAAAKNKDFSEIEAMLEELCQENMMEFLEGIKNSLGFAPLEEVNEEAILASLKEWYPYAPVFEKIRKGKRYGVGELVMYLRRCIRPTGVWIGFSGYRSAVWLEDVLRPIKPLFRRYCEVEKARRLGFVKLLSLVIRTSLVVEYSAKKCFIPKRFRKFIEVENERSQSEVSRYILRYLNDRVVGRLRKS